MFSVNFQGKTWFNISE